MVAVAVVSASEQVLASEPALVRGSALALVLGSALALVLEQDRARQDRSRRHTLSKR